MNINIENLSKTLNMERLKKDSAFNLLSKLGYTYDTDNGWDKDEPISEDVQEWMEGFEDLVRSDYKPSHADYLVSDKLSDEQRTFLQNMLETYSGSTFTCKQNISVVWNNEYQHFVGSGTLVGGKEITFNDLFIPKSQ